MDDFLMHYIVQNERGAGGALEMYDRHMSACLLVLQQLYIARKRRSFMHCAIVERELARW